MGTSASAKLVYGYDLGGANNGWKVQQADEYGCLDVDAIDWVTEDDDFDFGGAAEERLLASIGFTDTDWRANGYHVRLSEAKERLGLEIVFYSHHDSSMHALAAHVIEQGWSEGKVLDLTALAAMPEANGWDAKLAAAIEALGMTPTQAQPGWILVAEYG
jgi:hypothetical protein